MSSQLSAAEEAREGMKILCPVHNVPRFIGWWWIPYYRHCDAGHPDREYTIETFYEDYGDLIYGGVPRGSGD
jgi:hypothetical protein